MQTEFRSIKLLPQNRFSEVIFIYFSNPFHASTSLLTTGDVSQDNANPFSPDVVAANPFLAQTPMQPQQLVHGGDNGNKGFSFNSDKPLTPLNDVTNFSSTSSAFQKHPIQACQSLQSAGNNNCEVRRYLSGGRFRDPTVHVFSQNRRL